MRRIAVSILFYLTIIVGYPYPASASSPLESDTILRLEPIKKDDRVLIFVPHPDDEAIGCAGIIQEALDKGAEINVVYLTHGDNNEFAFIVYEKRLTF